MASSADVSDPEADTKYYGPPGTGKTTQLQNRIVALLDEGYSLSDVCYVTYRREMAQEFLRRLYKQDFIGYKQLTEPWDHEETRFIGTIHAISNRMINTDRDVATDADRRDFIESVWNQTYQSGGGTSEDSFNDGTSAGELMFDAYQYCLSNRIKDIWQAPQSDDLRDKWESSPPQIDRFHESWTEYKRDRGLIDFTEMLLRVDNADQSPPRDIVVVDEYHDNTPRMHAICRTWLADARVSLVGADPNQAIYSYQGADPGLYRELDLPERMLDKSYRLTEEVWDYAAETIRHDLPDVETAEREGEVAQTNRGPVDLYERYGQDGSIMYLARTRSQVRDLNARLRDAGVVFRSGKRLGGWNGSARRLAIYNALAKLRGVGTPGRSVNPNTGLIGMNEYQSDDAGIDGPSPKSVELDGDEARHLLDRTPATYVDGTKSTLLTKLGGKDTVEGEYLVDALEESFWRDMTNGAASASALLTYDGKEEIKSALDRYDRPFEALDLNKVPTTSTIHGAKGAEADTVVLYDGITGSIRDGFIDPEKRKAESRVWYVGATRAADRLLISDGWWDWTTSYLTAP